MVRHKPFLAFDERYGHPREEFFHFLWGYLLPALHWVSRRPDPSRVAVRMLTCGPTMDPVAAEAFGMLGARLDILTDAPATGEIVRLPRWDIVLRRNLDVFVPVDPTGGVVSRVLTIAAKRWPHPRSLPRPFELVLLRNSIAGLRKRLLPVAMETGLDRDAQGRVLILKRSEPPDFYKDGGGARKKGYGTTRRALIGIEDAAAEFERQGVPVTIFEPGRESFATQIRAFSEAAGIVAIRGAELGNLIWMRKGTPGVMLAPLSMQKSHRLPKLISEVAEIHLVEMEVASEFPTLEAKSILPYFAKELRAG